MGAEEQQIDPAPRSSKRAWFGYGIAAASLVWVFHDVSFRDVWSDVRSMKPEWLLVAVLVDILAYLTQGWRWHRLLSAIGKVPTLQATKATYAGLYLNEMLPLRLGELLRIHLIARHLGGAYSAVMSSVIVERFIDAVWLSAAFGVVVAAARLPSFLVDAEKVLVSLVFAGLTTFVLVAWISEKGVKRGMPPSNNRLIRVFRPLGEGLSLIGRSRSFLPALLVSTGVLGFQALAFYFVGVSYGLQLGFWEIIAAFLVQHVGNVIPGAPGNLGTYQLLTVLGLTLFGLDKTTASGFSVVVFLVLTIPLWIIGSTCFARSGLQLGSIRSELASWRAQAAEEQ